MAVIRKIVTRQETGQTRKIKIRLKKWRCSSVRRVCLQCETAVIHKLSKQYDLKICKNCSMSLSRSHEEMLISPLLRQELQEPVATTGN